MVPENRKEQGLFLDHSVEDNVAISSLDRFVSRGIIRRQVTALGRAQRDGAVAAQIECRRPTGEGHCRAATSRKAALARWLLRDCDVLILDEPTRGVDIGAKREIYEQIDGLARAGKAILVISSDLPEAIGISDRLLVMREGRIVAELESYRTSEEEVMLHATGTAAGAANTGEQA